MDISLLIPVLLLSLITFIFSFYLFFSKRNSDYVAANVPPGSTGWPLIGETLAFVWNTATPNKFIQERVRKYSSKIFKTSLFGEPFAIVCDAAGNKFLFSNENKLVQSWWPKSVYMVAPILDKLNKEGVKLRRLVLDCLSPQILQNFIGIMDSVAKKHFETHWDGKEEVVVLPLVKNFTFTLGCHLFLGVEDLTHLKELDNLFRVMLAGLISLPVNFPGTKLNRAIKASHRIQEKIVSLVKQKKIELSEKKEIAKKDDILAYMLSYSDEDRQFMSELDIAQLVGLLISGNDSSNSTVTLVMMYLAEHPDVYDKVYKEHLEILAAKGTRELLNMDDIRKMHYSWNVVCETLRLKPPIAGTFREALTEFNYEGFLIPKRWKLFWSTNWTHMKAEYFPEPEKFDPSRFDGNGPAPFTFVPFGGGARICPGREYAKIFILVFIHNLVTKYRWEKSIPNEKVVMKPGPIPAKGLPVRLRHHNSSEGMMTYLNKENQSVCSVIYN